MKHEIVEFLGDAMRQLSGDASHNIGFPEVLPINPGADETSSASIGSPNNWRDDRFVADEEELNNL